MVPSFLPLRMPAPGRNGMRVTLRGFPFAAAVGMVDRILDDAPRLGADAEPARTTGLADAHILVIGVAHHADRGEAHHREIPNLSRRQPELGICAFFGH